MRPKDLLVPYSSAAEEGGSAEGGMMGRVEVVINQKARPAGPWHTEFRDPKTLLITHPWVGDGVADIGQEIAGEAECAGDESDGEDQLAVALGDGIDEEISHAIDAE